MGGGDEVRAFFDGLAERFRPAAAEDLDVVYAFDLAEAGMWHVVVAGGTCSAHEGPHPAPGVTIVCGADDWLAIAGGVLDAQFAYQTGRLRVIGDMHAAMRLRSLFL